jgi:hypothetical protein
MKTRLLILLLLSSFTFAQAQKKLAEIDGFSSPESVISDGQFLYVSNVGTELKPLEKDGDGYISRLTADGKVLNMKFITGLNAPKGSAIIGSVLFVTDIDQIVGFDTKTQNKVFTLAIPNGPKFLNDLVAISDTILIASATDVNKLYRINIKLKKYREMKVTSMPPAPNGLVYDPLSSLLYVNTYDQAGGVIVKIDLSKKDMKAEEVSQARGSFDGMALDNKQLLVSDWGGGAELGRLIRVDPSKMGAASPANALTLDATVVEASMFQLINLDEKLSGPADFLFVSKTRTLFLPCMMTGKLLVYILD